MGRFMIVVLALAATSSVAGGQLHLERGVLAGGGGASSGPLFRVDATCGQAAAGRGSSPAYLLEAGFWHALAASSSVPADPPAQPTHYEIVAARGSLTFGLPERSRIEVRLYDVTGRAVRLLAAGEYEPGWHAASLETQGLASGIYFCRLTTAGTAVTRRVMLMR